MKPPVFIFMGISGSGKGTQSRMLQEYLKQKYPAIKTLYIGTGKELRTFVEERTNYTSKLIEEGLAQGNLMPDFMPVYLWTQALIQGYSGNEHVIFDGVTRHVAQAEILEHALQFYKIEKTYVFNVVVSPEEVKRRMLSRGRNDDTNDNIDERLQWHETKVVPAINYLRTLPNTIFVDVNGEQSPEAVHADIIQSLDS